MIVVVSEERGTVTCFRRGEALEVGPEGLRTMLIGLIEEGLQNAVSRTSRGAKTKSICSPAACLLETYTLGRTLNDV